MLDSHPYLLTYTAEQLEGELLYLTTMMALPRPAVVQACAAQSELLLMGTKGALNTGRAAEALGAASKATGRAAQVQAGAQAAALRARAKRGGT